MGEERTGAAIKATGATLGLLVLVGGYFATRPRPAPLTIERVEPTRAFRPRRALYASDAAYERAMRMSEAETR